jgi:hypothetical protein
MFLASSGINSFLQDYGLPDLSQTASLIPSSQHSPEKKFFSHDRVKNGISVYVDVSKVVGKDYKGGYR